MVAHKFGGSSVADAARIREVAAIVLARRDVPQVVVVSAMRGVTDALIGLAHQAAARDPGWQDAAAALERRHLLTTGELLGAAAAPVVTWLEHEFRELRELLHALALLKTPSAEALAYIQGLGEVFSARIIAAYFAQASGHAVPSLDAREVLSVRHEDMGAVVDWEDSGRRLAAWRAQHDAPLIVITGFVARDAEPRAAPPRWGAMAATIPARSSPRCSTPARCRSGPTSTACSRPTRASCPRPCWCRN